MKVDMRLLLWCCCVLVPMLSHQAMYTAEAAVEANGMNPCTTQANVTRYMSGIYIETDKFNHLHRYQFFYAQLFRCSRATPMQFLEIGLGCYFGFFAMEPRMWSHTLPLATQHYVEYDQTCTTRYPYLKTDVNGNIFIGDQSDLAFLANVVVPKLSLTGMDVIIDDGSHQPRHQLISFKYLFPRLIRPGGYYVVEDLFFNFDSRFNSESNSTIVALAVRILEAFAGTGSLPNAVRECSEVVCQFGLCWFKKKGEYPEGIRSPWCESSSASNSSSRVSVAYSNFPTHLLSCEGPANYTVLHVQSCQDNSSVGSHGSLLKRILPIFEPANVVPYRIDPGCSSASSDALLASLKVAPLVVVDDSDGLPTNVRLRALRDLFEHRLPAGGYYFWRNSQRTAESASPFILALYSEYCNMKSKFKVKGTSKRGGGHHYRTQVFHDLLCQTSFRDAWRVGCDEIWCYIQKRPSFYVPLQPTEFRKLRIVSEDYYLIQSKLFEFLNWNH